MNTQQEVEGAVSQLKTMAENRADLPQAVQGFLARNPQRQGTAVEMAQWRVNWEEKWITNYPDDEDTDKKPK